MTVQQMNTDRISSPAVSVIIPCYNVVKYLPRCLDSVLSQTIKDFEIVCVNDGSRDASGQVLKEYAAQHESIRIIEQENQGLSMARNNALKIAQGEFVFFLDSDDYIHPQLLEICLYFARRYEASMVQCNLRPSNKGEISGEYVAPEKVTHHVTDAPLFLTDRTKYPHLYVCACCKLFRRELIEDIEFIPGIFYEDIPHTYAVCLRRPRTVCLQCDLYSYTIRPGSQTHIHATAQQIQDRAKCIDAVCQRMEKAATVDEQIFMRRRFIPRFLGESYKACIKAPAAVKEELLDTFADELRDLRERGYLHWRGHKLRRYWAYKRIMKRPLRVAQ